MKDLTQHLCRMLALETLPSTLQFNAGSGLQLSCVFLLFVLGRFQPHKITVPFSSSFWVGNTTRKESKTKQKFLKFEQLKKKLTREADRDTAAGLLPSCWQRTEAENQGVGPGHLDSVRNPVSWASPRHGILRSITHQAKHLSKS